MKKIAWNIYGVLIILFILLNIWAAISTGNALIVTLLSTAFTILYLTGLYGYVYHKTLWNPSAWRFLFWLNVVSITLRSLLLLFSPTTEVVIDVIFSTVFSLPMLYALYQYSSSNNTLWGESHYGKQKALLSGLLERANELMTSVVSSTPNGDEKTTVILKNDGNEFIVKILKETNKETNSFSNSFSDLKDVVKFLENNTPIRAGDFA